MPGPGRATSRPNPSANSVGGLRKTHGAFLLLSRRTALSTSTEQSVPTEVLAEAAEPATEEHATGRRRLPAGLQRPGLYLAVAVAGGIMVNVFTAGQPA